MITSEHVFTGRLLVWVTYRPPAPSPGSGVLVQSSVTLLATLLTASALLCSPSLALASLDQPSHACTLNFSDQRVLNQSLLLLYNSGTVSRVPQFWKCFRKAIKRMIVTLENLVHNIQWVGFMTNTKRFSESINGKIAKL